MLTSALKKKNVESDRKLHLMFFSFFLVTDMIRSNMHYWEYESYRTFKRKELLMAEEKNISTRYSSACSTPSPANTNGPNKYRRLRKKRVLRGNGASLQGDQICIIKIKTTNILTVRARRCHA